MRRNLVPLLTLSALQFADAGTTYAALARGAAEVNPVASLAFGFAGVLTTATVLKLALLLWATMFACLSRRARPFLLAAIAAYALVVLNNLIAVAPGAVHLTTAGQGALTLTTPRARAEQIAAQLRASPHEMVDDRSRPTTTLVSLQNDAVAPLLQRHANPSIPLP
jgi:hypothetical protein